MEFWRTVLENPTGDKAMDDFAVAIDNTPKIVFSRTLKNVDWKSAKLANQDLERRSFGTQTTIGVKTFLCAVRV